MSQLRYGRRDRWWASCFFLRTKGIYQSSSLYWLMNDVIRAFILPVHPCMGLNFGHFYFESKEKNSAWGQWFQWMSHTCAAGASIRHDLTVSLLFAASCVISFTNFSRLSIWVTLCLHQFLSSILFPASLPPKISVIWNPWSLKRVLPYEDPIIQGYKKLLGNLFFSQKRNPGDRKRCCIA